MMRERMLSLRAWQPRDADGSPPMARPLQDPFDATASPGAAPDKGGSTPEFFLPPSPGSLVNGLPVLSWDQAAAQLTRGGYSWSTTNGEPIVITYAFRASVSAFELSQLPAGVSGFAQFNAIQIAVVDEIMRLWSEVANIQLVRVGEGTSGPGAYSNNASILLGNYTTGPAAFSAFAFLPSPTAAGAADLEGNIWVNVSRNYDADPLTFSLGAQILVHEIGHALGLLHPEDYGGGANGGANYIDDATFWQDTSQFMTMSYFSPSFTGANFGINARAPQMHDIAAAQLLYGPNTTTRTGDTTYGFNSNSGHSVFSIGAANQASVFTIWDAGGTDTLDLSGYTTNSEIDLREQAFSSAGPGNGGPAVYNIAIARGAVIENAIGGAGADTLIGNAADNVLTGNAGADSINGNGGIDTANYDGSNAAVSVNLATGEALGGHAQGDTFQSIESLIGTAFDDTLTGDAEANSISGLGGADTLNGGDGNDTLYGHSAGATGEINVVAIATGMGASPLSTGAATPADAGFLYIVQKDTGVIFRVDEATGARTTFLDVQDTLFSGGGERGVLGLAFHPNYSGNGRFFVFLTDPQGDLQVREYHRSSTDPAVADNASTLVIEIPKQTGFTNHNGGWIGFSPDDGYLYVATGDGGGAGDPGNNSQDLNDLLGKILRINVDADGFPADAARNYAVPANNPFVGIAGADEIWAYGVRNPWRLAFDPRNGDLYIADVGQSAREEVNFQSAGFAGGANYGWRIMEGTLTFNPGPPGTPQPGDPSLTLPVYEYGRFFGGSITGGEVYVGANAGMTGHYVFADYLSGRLFTLMMHNGAAVNAEDRSPQITGAELTNVVDFVTGATGQLYAVGYGGTLWRLDLATGAEDFGDTLNGGAGDDAIYGGAGDDAISGGLGNDFIDAGIGNDTITWDWGDGADTIDGGADDDRLNMTGDGAENVLDATYDGVSITNLAGLTLSNVDHIAANMGAGTDWLVYTTSAAVQVALNSGTASGFPGLMGVENVIGGSGNDQLRGSHGVNNRLDGGVGDDFLDGFGGEDILIGGDGNDMLVGGIGNDSMQGGAGNDAFNWANGDGRDTFNGGEGVDTLNVTGVDLAEIARANWNGAAITGLMDGALISIEAINLNLGAAVDWLIYNTSADVTVNLAAGTATGFASVANIEKVVGGSGDDTLTGNDGDNRLDGQGGADVLDGGAGSDAVLGGAGDDVIFASAGNDSLQGQAGADTFHWTSTDGRDTFNGGADADTVNLSGSAVADVADTNWNGSVITGLLNNALVDVESVHLDLGEGGAGGDWLRYNTASGISVDLGAGAATGFASITGVENLIGGTGNDALTGDAGANKINGANGDDVINGGGGADNLSGGAGLDTFVYAAGCGNDTINDFDAWDNGGQDFLDVSAFGIDSGNFGSRVAIIDTGADTVIRIDDTYFITLKNVSGDGDNAITSDDFLFA